MYLYSSFKNAINVAPLRGLWTGRLRLALARLAAEGFQPLPPLPPPPPLRPSLSPHTALRRFYHRSLGLYLDMRIPTYL